MSAPVVTVGDEHVAVRLGAVTVRCDRDRFTADIPGRTPVDVPVSARRKKTDDPWINCMAGLVYLVARLARDNDNNTKQSK